MPNPSLRGGLVKEWHKSVGDDITFGEEVCTIAFDDFAALRRTARATLLSGKKRTNLKSKLEHRRGKVLLEMVVTSAEQGTVGKIIAEPGTRFAVGDTLALITTGGDEVLASANDWSDRPAMRVVANDANNSEHF